MFFLDINNNREVIISTTKNKEIYLTIAVDALPEDFNDYHWQYISGELVKKEHVYVKTLDDFKADKLAELETYIAGLKETGVEYDGKPFKCDSEAQNNLTQSLLFIDSLLPLTWFTRNGEQGTITFTTKEDFMQFVNVLAGTIAEIQNKNYAFKYQIELAQSKEELDAIVFEEVEEENVTE